MCIIECFPSLHIYQEYYKEFPSLHIYQEYYKEFPSFHIYQECIRHSCGYEVGLRGSYFMQGSQ